MLGRMATYDTIVLGAGAAGLMCALTAGARGRRVLVLERVQQARQEDPDVGRRTLQFHQPALRAGPLPVRQPAFLQERAAAATRSGTSSNWSKATASSTSRRKRSTASAGSCSAGSLRSRSWRCCWPNAPPPASTCSWTAKPARSTTTTVCAWPPTAGRSSRKPWWWPRAACRCPAWAAPASATAWRSNSACGCCPPRPAWCR